MGLSEADKTRVAAIVRRTMAEHWGSDDREAKLEEAYSQFSFEEAAYALKLVEQQLAKAWEQHLTTLLVERGVDPMETESPPTRGKRFVRRQPGDEASREERED